MRRENASPIPPAAGAAWSAVRASFPVADEALAGHGKKIKVTLHADGSVSIEDDGRGIPFGLHPEEKAPVIELVFTRLHAGGKFDKGKGGAYSFSGGLHGVGVSVTNALAKRLEAISYREGQVAALAFSGGDVIEQLVTRKAGEGDRKQGTTVRVWPDAKYFESSVLPMTELTHLLRSKAVLMPGVTVTLFNEKTKETQTWQYKAGLRDYLMQTLNGDPVIPLFENEGFADSNHDSFAEGEGASWAVAFTEDGQPVRESYVNLIPTTAGGTHDSGLRDGLFTAVKSFIELHSLLPKGVKLMPEDVFARASFVLSAKVLDPQFQGQIKERLNSRDAVGLNCMMTVFSSVPSICSALRLFRKTRAVEIRACRSSNVASPSGNFGRSTPAMRAQALAEWLTDSRTWRESGNISG